MNSVVSWYFHHILSWFGFGISPWFWMVFGFVSVLRFSVTDTTSVCVRVLVLVRVRVRVRVCVRARARVCVSPASNTLSGCGGCSVSVRSAPSGLAGPHGCGGCSVWSDRASRLWWVLRQRSVGSVWSRRAGPGGGTSRRRRVHWPGAAVQVSERRRRRDAAGTSASTGRPRA